MFFLSEKHYRACHCGAKTAPIAQDKNQFAESVQMDALVQQLDNLIAQSPDASSALRKDSQLSAIIGRFFTAVKEQMMDV